MQKPTRVVARMTTIKCAPSTDSAHHAIIRDAIYSSMHLYLFWLRCLGLRSWTALPFHERKLVAINAFRS